MGCFRSKPRAWGEQERGDLSTQSARTGEGLSKENLCTDQEGREPGIFEELSPQLDRDQRDPDRMQLGMHRSEALTTL